MHQYMKFFVGTLAATALFASLAASATANRLALSTTNIRTVFAPLIFPSSIGANISCTVTMEGSFHSATLSKVSNSLIGYITRATADTPNCREEGNGNVIRGLVKQETLPWHLRYINFIGTLPNVRARVQIIRLGIELLNVPGLGRCVYSISPFFIVEGPFAGSNINTGNAFLRAEEAQEHASSTFFCPSKRIAGRSAATALGTTTPITVRLI